MNINNPKKIHTLIKRPWGEWRNYKKKQYEEREQELENLLTEANKSDQMRKVSSI